MIRALGTLCILPSLILGQIGSFQVPESEQYNPYLSPSTCKDPQILDTCYVTYLAKYNIHPMNGYLPHYSHLERIVKTQLDIVNICRDFDELNQCLGAAAVDCVSLEAFALFTQKRDRMIEAELYLQNHAFFEFSCGAGRTAFFSNSVCLSDAFAEASLTQRMTRCEHHKLHGHCDRAVRLTQCVRAELTAACGPDAGVASCGAATNILRREADVDGMCVMELDQRCSAFATTTFGSIILCALLFSF